MTAKTTNGQRLLVGRECLAKPPTGDAPTPSDAAKPANRAVGARFVAHKLRVDELDTEIATKELLFLRLGLSVEWQDKNIILQKVHNPKLEVKESREYAGLMSWYFVQEVDMYIKDNVNHH